MAHELLRELDGRLGGAAQEVFGATGAHDGVVQELNGVGADFFSGRVGIEDHRVAGGEHADTVADDGLGGVRGRRDGADDAEGCVLFEHEAVVAGLRPRLEDLGARRLVDDQAILDDLLIVAAEAGLFEGHARDVFDLAVGALTHRRDDRETPLQPHSLIGLEGALRRRHRFVEVREHTASAAARAGRRARHATDARCALGALLALAALERITTVRWIDGRRSRPTQLRLARALVRQPLDDFLDELRELLFGDVRHRASATLRQMPWAPVSRLRR